MKHARLLELLTYDPLTGEFRRMKTTGGQPAGSIAGSVSARGYICICVDGKTYYAHRLAHFYMTGEWPSNDIDHVDGDTKNNAWVNLRDVTTKVNMQNRRKAAMTNKSGLLGAWYNSRLNKYVSAIKRPDGVNQYLGVFATAEAAHEAHVAAKRQLHEGNTL